MAGRYCEGKIKMASEKVSREMVLEIKYVNAKTRIVQMIELVFTWLCEGEGTCIQIASISAFNQF